MSDRLRESVSALIDGETDDLEWRRLLASDDFSQVRTVWSDFQRVRGGLTGVDAAIAQLDISPRVQAALVDEVPGLPESTVVVDRWRWWRPAASVAVAASMAAVVVMGVSNFSGSEPGVSVTDAGVAAAVNASPDIAAISPNAGKVFPAMPSPLRGSSTVSANYGGAYGNVPANIGVPVQMYGSSQARAEAEAQLRRRLQAYLLMQVERDTAQAPPSNP